MSFLLPGYRGSMSTNTYFAMQGTAQRYSNREKNLEIRPRLVSVAKLGIRERAPEGRADNSPGGAKRTRGRIFDNTGAPAGAKGLIRQ